MSSDDAELVLGREAYTKNCVSCHAADGSGGRGPKLNEGKLDELYPNSADQQAVIQNGQGPMPAFEEKLSEEELAAVVRFTRESLP